MDITIESLRKAGFVQRYDGDDSCYIATVEDRENLGIYVAAFIGESGAVEMFIMRELIDGRTVMIKIKGAATIESACEFYRLLTGKSLTYEAPNQRGD